MGKVQTVIDTHRVQIEQWKKKIISNWSSFAHEKKGEVITNTIPRIKAKAIEWKAKGDRTWQRQKKKKERKK